MYQILTTVLFVAIFSFSAKASDSNIRNSQDCFSGEFQSYESWKQQLISRNKKVPRERLNKIIDKRYPKEKFDAYKANLSCSNFQYRVDGVWVDGFAISNKSMSKEKSPVIVFNRGGNGNFGTINFTLMLDKLFPFAQSGFVVVGSQYRGTGEKNPEFDDEFGGADVADVSALIESIPQIVKGDPKRIGMLGVSRGGMQSFLAIKDRADIKAVATIAAATDLMAELEFRPEMESVYKKRIPNYSTNKEDELSNRSVVNWVDKLPADLPILLLHGENDKRVSVENSKKFASLLEKEKRPHKLVVYPKDNHFLRLNAKKAEKEIIDWFKKYL